MANMRELLQKAKEERINRARSIPKVVRESISFCVKSTIPLTINVPNIVQINSLNVLALGEDTLSIETVGEGGKVTHEFPVGQEIDVIYLNLIIEKNSVITLSCSKFDIYVTANFSVTAENE